MPTRDRAKERPPVGEPSYRYLRYVLSSGIATMLLVLPPPWPRAACCTNDNRTASCYDAPSACSPVPGVYEPPADLERGMEHVARC